MQYEQTAQGLASLGRGPDTQLMHMAPQEVAGLQALAQAHGGSLTINPDTGLPEAGFLSSILPMVVGAGLSIASGGALTPLMAAGIMGGGTALATGSLQKGLMAGLGAYGGAGLGAGLMGAGAAGAAGVGAEAALGAMGPQTAAQLGTGLEASLAAQGITPTLGATGASMGAQTAAQLGSGFEASMAAQGVSPTAVASGTPLVPTATAMPELSFFDKMSNNFSQAGRGFGALSDSAGRDAFLGNAASKDIAERGAGGLGGLLKYGGAAASPFLMDSLGSKASNLPVKDPLRRFDYTYNPGTASDPQAGYTGAYTGERTYFNPTFTRTAAGGGLMDVHARFAEGGTTGVKPVEDDPYYSMTGQSADAFKYLMGQGARPETQTPNAVSGTGFFNGGFGAASPGADGTFGGTVIPGGGGFFGPGVGTTGSGGGVFSPGVGTAGSGNTYTFDPNTGLFTRTAAPELGAVGSGSGLLNAFYGDGYDGGGYGGDAGGGGGGASGPGGDGNTGSAGSAADGTGDGGPGGVGGWAQGGITALAHGGASHLGDYSDGGRLLRGPGDGVSDDIPAVIGTKQPARLADGEFVVPARIVSELGNGSTEAGAKQLYAMLARVQKARGKTVGKNKVAVDAKARNLLPA